MGTLDIVRANLLSPMVLAFGLGLFAKLVKSDLKLPSGLYATLSIYLLFAIGLKGGVALSEADMAQVIPGVLGTLLLGVLTPVLAFGAARRPGGFSVPDSAALAAHYGSVSAVTFIAALTAAQSQFAHMEGFMPALVAVLEIPAILVAILLSRRATGPRPIGPVAHELLTGRTTMLLAGGLAIGWIAGPKGAEQVTPLFGDMFRGALTIFLLEMGLLAGEQLSTLRGRVWSLVAFGLVVPILNGLLGAAVGTLAGLSPGGAAVLGAMTASASYIAAPAAVRVAIPEANPGVYLTAALGITFPFNLIVGIPLYSGMAIWLSEHL